MTSGIYAIYDKLTGDCLYVGQSIDIDGRWYYHRRLLNRGEHHNKELQEFFSRQPDSLVHKVLEECSGEALHAKEIEWSDRLEPRFWGRKPGRNWRWTEIAPSVIERMNEERGARAKERFYELNEEWGARVKALYESGETTETIPQVTGLSFGSVLKLLKYQEVEFRSRRDTVGFEYSRGKTDDELRTELQSLRAEGKSWPQIAKRWGCGDTTLKDLTRRLGIYEAPPKFALAGMSDGEVKRRILELEDQGLKHATIAKELGVGSTTLFRRLHRYFPERFNHV